MTSLPPDGVSTADRRKAGNPLSQLSRYELRHLPAHLAAAGQFDEMHRLLRLSFIAEPGAATENAWFSAKDAVSELTSFANDVELAWRSEVGRGVADVPLELRYALMRSSMRTQTAQVPGALVIALVERGVWSAEQGLSQAWRHADDTRGEARARALLLAAVLRHLEPEQRSTYFTAMHEQARQLEIGRAEVLWELVSSAPDAAREPLVEEALKATRQEGPRAVTEVLPRVPPAARRLLWPDLVKAFNARSAYLEPELQERALSAIGPQLTMVEIEHAIALTRKMTRAGAQGPAIASLAMHLPEERRLAIASQELAAAVGGEAAQEWADRLTALCPVLPTPWADAALDTAARITNLSTRAMVLSVLVQALDRHDPRRARVIRQAITMSRNYGNELWHARLMAMLARSCPEHESAAMWQEALAAARGLGNGSFLDALEWIAPYVDAAATEGFLEAARSVQRPTDLAKLLWLAAANLHADQRTALLREALRTTDSAESGFDVAWVIERLAAQLPDELIDEGIDRAERIGEISWRQQALAALAPYLDGTRLRRALAAARAISDGVDATNAILAVAAVNSGTSRGIWELAHSLADAIREPVRRASAFTQLARAAQEPERTIVLAEAQSAAQRIASPYERCDALTELAGDLAGKERHTALAEALAAIRRQDTGGDLDDRLRRVARLMPRDLLAEALRFARGLYSSFSAHAIAALVPFLPRKLRAAACEEALMTGSARFENAGDMHKLIVNLAPYLPPQVMSHAVSAAWGIDQDETRYRQSALLSLIPRLNEAERRKVLSYAETVFSDAEMDTFRRNERSAELRTRVEHASLATADEREMLLNAVVSEEEDQRVPLLVPLIPLLTGEARTRAVACALSAARSLKYNSAPALAALVDVLPQEPARETAEEAIAAAIAGSPGTRFEALLTAAPALRTADRKRALEGAFDDAFATLRQPIIMGGRLEGFRRQLPAAASGLPPGIRAALVLHGVRELDQLARADVLRAIAAFMPTLLAAEAAPAVADVIVEVESWWP